MNGFNLSNIQNAMLGSTQVSALYYGSKLIWENFHDYSIEYFTIEPTTSDGADVYVTKGKQNQSVNLSYSTDLINWTSATINTYGTNNYTLLYHVFYGEKMYIKGINNALGTGAGAGVRIYAIEPYKVYGNIMSLLYGDNFANQTTLPDHYSFVSLFNNSNNGLTDASNLILPATTLTGYCYHQMFQNCKQLTKAPELPATTLSPGYCYYAMFRGCTSLTAAPVLPATTLADSCYYSMFYGCTSLTSAPVLPATTLADSCYRQMFYGCTSLTSAPELPATILVTHCYNSMFYNCKSLNKITMLATNISASSCLQFWVRNVAATGTFTKSASMTTLPTGTSGIPSGWNVSNIYNVNIDNSIVGGTITSNIAYALPNETVILTVTPDPHCTLQSLTVVDENDNPVTVTNNQFTMPNSNVTVSAVFNINYNEMYLTIESLKDNNDIGWKSNNSTTKTIQWSTDMTNWTSATSSTSGTTLTTLNAGDKLYIKGNNSAYGATWSTYSYFTINDDVNIYGHMNSLLYGDNFINNKNSLPRADCTFWFIFNHTPVIDASHVIFPNAVRNMAYRNIFEGCTKLLYAPELPNVCAYQAYNSMFRNCTSLTTAPTIKFSDPDMYGCESLFDGCTSLNSVTSYLTFTGTDGIRNWLRNVAATGTFTKPSTMTSYPSGASGIPSGWTVVDV